MEEGKDVGFGESFEYKGKRYWYIKEIKVKMRDGKIIKGEQKGEWVTCVLYYNNHGTFAREKREFFKRFTKC